MPMPFSNGSAEKRLKLPLLSIHSILGDVSGDKVSPPYFLS
jgi:hypothetical protein